MASNLKRSKRTVGKRIDDLHRRVLHMQKRPAPRRIGSRVIVTTNLTQDAVTNVELAPDSVTAETIVAGTITSTELAEDAGGADTTFTPTAPASPVVGDLWFDSSDSVTLKRWSGSAWVSMRDLGIAAAAAGAAAADAAAVAAQSTADGKNKVYRDPTEPSGGTYTDGDLWFDTDDNNKVYRRTGSAWTAVVLGGNAIANIDAGSITAGTIAAARINAASIAAAEIDAAKITAGVISSARITSASIAAGVITADKITAGTLTGVTVNATVGNIGGFTLNSKSLASAYSSVQVEMFGDLTGNQHVDLGLSNAFTGGFFAKNVSDGRRAFLGYDGTYVYDTDFNGGYSFYSNTQLSVCRTNKGRMWIDHDTDTVGRIRYTSAGTGSFPGLIVSPRAELSFASNAIYTFNEFGVNASANKSTSGVDNDEGVWLQGAGSSFTRGSGVAIVLNQTAAGTAAAAVVRFRRNGIDEAAITVSDTATAYGTGSDYRLKENVKPVEDPISVIDKLRPVEFTWKVDKDKWGYGFIAHELAEIIPYAVYGEKDAINEDGSPNHQQVDYSTLTPILTASLKKVLEKVRVLEAKVKELESNQ